MVFGHERILLFFAARPLLEAQFRISPDRTPPYARPLALAPAATADSATGLDVHSAPTQPPLPQKLSVAELRRFLGGGAGLGVLGDWQELSQRATA